MPDDAHSIDVRRISPEEAQFGVVELYDGEHLLATTFYANEQTMLRFEPPSPGSDGVTVNATALRRALDDVREQLGSV